MMRASFVTLTAFALASFAGSVACSSSSSASDEPSEIAEGALLEGQKVVCTPVELSEATVDYQDEVYEVQKITFTMKADETVQLRVDRKTESGGRMDPIIETTPSFVHTDRTIRASAKRNVLLKAGKTRSSDPGYVGFASVRDYTFAVECTVQNNGRPPSRCRDGASRPDVDGCNTCSCSDGRWACTELFCGQPQRPPGGRGRVCRAGDSRPAGDGCNTCGCGANGQWGACTELACGPRPGRGNGGGRGGCTDGQTMSLDGCNTCTCNGGSFACTELFCG